MTGGEDLASLAVVHLVVRELGIDYFREFIGSYRAFDAGVDHVLILALKQFGGEADFSPYQKELAGIEYEILHVPDLGHDIGSYVAIASETEFQRYCFINSKTTLNTDKWLEKLIAEHDKNPDGMVGSTGSWQSLASDALKYRLDTRPVLLLNIRRVLGYLWRLRKFPGFPNPHLRTNVFVVSRETFRSLDFGRIGSKNDTWKLESGRNSISRQIERRGGALVVVDREGRSYRPESWARSDTFWQDDQQGLLVSDRQTRIYEQANPDERSAMQAEAWERPRLPYAKETLLFAASAFLAAVLVLILIAGNPLR